MGRSAGGGGRGGGGGRNNGGNNSGGGAPAGTVSPQQERQISNIERRVNRAQTEDEVFAAYRASDRLYDRYFAEGTANEAVLQRTRNVRRIGTGRLEQIQTERSNRLREAANQAMREAREAEQRRFNVTGSFRR